MKQVITIIGPTASGKTSVCVKLSVFKSIEVISADSRQIYKYMDIGTGKPTPKEKEKVAHHLIDIIDPDEKYSAAKFGRECKEKVKEINSRGNIPIICGGTVLYIKAILEGLFLEPYIPEEIREEIRNQVEEKGPEKMHEELSKVDSKSGERIHPNDRQRIARALEVFRASGISLSEHLRKGNKNILPLNMYCLLPERNFLHKNIEKRIKEMFRCGFVDEVKNLLSMGYNPSLYSFTSIGYREIAKFLLNRKNGNINEIEGEITKKTKEYSSRQITFIKGLKGVQFYKTKDTLTEGLLEELKTS